MAGSPAWWARTLQRESSDRSAFYSNPRFLRPNRGCENRWKWDFLPLQHSLAQYEWGCEGVWYVYRCMFWSPETQVWLICRSEARWKYHWTLNNIGLNCVSPLICGLKSTVVSSGNKLPCFVSPPIATGPSYWVDFPNYSNFKNMWLGADVHIYNVHFTWIHLFALFGLKKYSIF